MSIKEYPYRRCTHKQVVACINWCKEKFNMRDWEIDIYTDETPPEIIKKKYRNENNVGVTNVRGDYLKATMWIPLGHNDRQDSNVIQTAIHEFIHVITLGLTDIALWESEILSYRLEVPLYELYCFEHDIKLEGK